MKPRERPLHAPRTPHPRRRQPTAGHPLAERLGPEPRGLVRALLPLLRSSGGTWVGWTGEADDVPDPFVLDGVNLQPVLVTAEEVQDYYEGFSNDTLWPLYHDALRDSTYSGQHWDAYQRVNQRFADALAEVAPDGAMVWIHDYHLQLVPQMLRDKRPDVVIGFFFHIPFPPVELFMRLPWRTEIAAGLSGCDLVGFQRAINAANFVVVCDELLGRSVHVGSYPISIDVEELEAVAAGRATRQRSNRYRTRLGEPEVVLLGVDRLDYTKGISQRLRAFHGLLDDGTLDVERCVMVQIATPTAKASSTTRTSAARSSRSSARSTACTAASATRRSTTCTSPSRSTSSSPSTAPAT